MIDNRLITFLTLLEEKNYTKTANKLYISQPAVTHHIKSLENEYNISLFDDSKSFKLTNAGSILYEHALRIKEENELLINTLANSSTKTIQKISITPFSFYLLKTNSILKEFYNILLENNISINKSNDIFTDISSGRVDFGIIDNSFDSTIFDSIPIISEKICLIAKSEGIYKNKDRITREQLNQSTIIYPDSLSGIYHTVIQGLKNKNIKIKSHHIMYSNSAIIMADMVNKLDGIGFMYYSTAKELAKEGNIKIIELLNYSPIQTIYLIYNKISSHNDYLINLNYNLEEILRKNDKDII